MGTWAQAGGCRGGVPSGKATLFQHSHLASKWRVYFTFYAIASAVIGMCPGRAFAANPAITGTLSVPFSFDTSNNAYYWPEFINGSYTLSLPPVLDISINSSALGPTTLDWTNKNNWTTFPLDSSGFSVTNNCCGSYNVKINNNDANLDVLGLSGPTENTAYTKVEILNIHGSGNIDGFSDVLLVSNNVPTKYNVTLPANAHVAGLASAKLQNLTINHNASLLGPGPTFDLIRQNLTNHGSGNFNGEVQGNFTNDALPANGDVANAIFLVVDGQLQNTGELRIPTYLKTLSASNSSGTMTLNGGEFTAGAAFANNGLFQLASGNIYGPGLITNNGTIQWTGADVRSTAQIANTTNAFTISTTGTKTLEGTLTNTGTITQFGGSNLEMQGGTLNNQAGALYDIIDDSHISFTLSAGTINNAGLFRKSGGSGMSYIGGSAMNNTGTISVSSGTLRFHAGGSLNGGAMNISGGALVQLEHGDFSVVGTNTASGSGTFEIDGGHVFAANGVSSSFANFTGGANLVVTAGLLEAKLGGTLTLNLTGSSSVQLAGDPTTSGGTIGGQGTTLNTGNFQWVHGMVVGKLTNSSANFTITNGGQSIFNSGVLTNTNTISQSNGSDMQMYQGGTISNQAGALWQMTGTNDIEDGFQGGPINNAGTWRKSGGSGTSTIAAPFNNSGTLAVDSGTLFFAGSELLNLTSPSKLSFKLSGLTPATDYGKVTTTHNLTAGGTLAVTLGPGFAPALGNSFDLFDWGSIDSFNGSFSALGLPALASGLRWDTSQLYSDGLLIVGVGLPGDFNQNGVVDAPDYVVWLKLLGTTYTPSDYGVWRSHFGQSAGNGSGGGTSASAVPEPANETLLLLGVLMVAQFYPIRTKNPRGSNPQSIGYPSIAPGTPPVNFSSLAAWPVRTCACRRREIGNTRSGLRSQRA